MARGRLLTFEGIEGCGKTTQMGLVVQRLEAAGVAVVTTREPGGTPLGEGLRALLLDPAHRPTPHAELFILEAARSQLVRDIVVPALEAGAFVLSDRFSDSSLAYQGEARGLGLETVEHLNALACGGIRPDRTVVIDLPVEEALARARGRTTTTVDNRRFEDEDLAFHAAVRRGFRLLAAREPDRVRLVDGSGDREAVSARVLAALEGLLP